MSEQTVGAVMTTDVLSVRPSTPVEEIATILTRHRISAVPVLDDHRGVLGVVSESDIMAAARRVPGLTAANLMNRPALTIHPTEPVTVAARRLSREGVRRLFVVDQGGTLVGVVARRDLLAPFLRSDEEIRHDIETSLAACRADVLDFPPVSVRVVNGQSILDGIMLLRSTTNLVHRLVSAVPGVVAVRNNLGYEIDDGPG